MKLQLLITKREITHHKTITKTKYLFAVIDLDKSKQYPQNFVSVLPKNIKTGDKPSNKFEELFGKDSIEMANQLLKKALRSRPDSETTKAIRDRLRTLGTKPVIKAQCRDCGKPFDLDKRKFRKYKLCLECYRKKLAKSY